MLTQNEFRKILSLYLYSKEFKDKLDQPLNKPHPAEYHLVSNQFIQKFKETYDYEGVVKLIKNQGFQSSTRNIHEDKLKEIYNKIMQEYDIPISSEDKAKLKTIENQKVHIQNKNPSFEFKYYYQNFAILDSKVFEELITEDIKKPGDKSPKVDMYIGNESFLIPLGESGIEVGIIEEFDFIKTFGLIPFKAVKKITDVNEKIKKIEELVGKYKKFDLKTKYFLYNQTTKGITYLKLPVKKMEEGETTTMKARVQKKELRKMGLSNIYGLTYINPIVLSLISINELKKNLLENFIKFYKKSPEKYMISYGLTCLINDLNSPSYKSYYEPVEFFAILDFLRMVKTQNGEELLLLDDLLSELHKENHNISENSSSSYSNTLEGKSDNQKGINSLCQSWNLENIQDNNFMDSIHNNDALYKSVGINDEIQYKKKILKEYIDSFQTKYNSIISGIFYWTKQIKKTCMKCNKGTYEFEACPLLEFELQNTRRYIIEETTTDVKFKIAEIRNNRNLTYLQQQQEIEKCIQNEENTPIHILNCLEYFNARKEVNSININHIQGDSYLCPNCKAETPYFLKKSIYASPKYFIFKLNRKNESSSVQLKYDDEINIGNYIEMNGTAHNYELYSVICCEKRQSGNYYYAYCKDEEQKWNRYEDKKITEVSKTDVHNSTNSVVLIYRSIKTVKK